MKPKKKGGKNEDTLPTWIIIFLSVLAGLFLIMVVIGANTPLAGYNPEQAARSWQRAEEMHGSKWGWPFRWW